MFNIITMVDVLNNIIIMLNIPSSSPSPSTSTAPQVQLPSTAFVLFIRTAIYCCDLAAPGAVHSCCNSKGLASASLLSCVHSAFAFWGPIRCCNSKGLSFASWLSCTHSGSVYRRPILYCLPLLYLWGRAARTRRKDVMMTRTRTCPVRNRGDRDQLCNEGGGRPQSEESQWNWKVYRQYRRRSWRREGIVFGHELHRCEDPWWPTQGTQKPWCEGGQQAWCRALRPTRQSGCGGKRGGTITKKLAVHGDCSRSKGRMPRCTSFGSGRKTEDIIHALWLIVQELARGTLHAYQGSRVPIRLFELIPPPAAGHPRESASHGPTVEATVLVAQAGTLINSAVGGDCIGCVVAVGAAPMSPSVA